MFECLNRSVDINITSLSSSGDRNSAVGRTGAAAVKITGGNVDRASG